MQEVGSMPLSPGKLEELSRLLDRSVSSEELFKIIGEQQVRILMLERRITELVNGQLGDNEFGGPALPGVRGSSGSTPTEGHRLSNDVRSGTE